MFDLNSKKNIKNGYLFISAFLLLLHANCSSPPSSRSRPVQFSGSLYTGDSDAASAKPTRAQLEDEILRFEGHFNALVSDAFHSLNLSSNQLRRQATNIKLNYLASSLDIALGAIPEQNIVDMVVFIKLIQEVFRDYWLPKVFKEEGRPVLVALEKASRDLEKMATTFILPAQTKELRLIVDRWHQQNPNTIAVEFIRMSDFSAEANARAHQIERDISGFLAPINQATMMADNALLLGERGLILAQRAPFLLRMQSTAAVQDTLDEIESTFENIPASQKDIDQIQSLLRESQITLRELQPLIRELQPLIVEYRKITEQKNQSPATKGQSPTTKEGSQNLIENILEILKEFNQILKSGFVPNASQISGATDRLKTEVRVFFLGLGLLSALLILFAGAVYVIAKLTYERLSIKRMVETKSEKKGKAA